MGILRNNPGLWAIPRVREDGSLCPIVLIDQGIFKTIDQQSVAILVGNRLVEHTFELIDSSTSNRE